MNKKLRIISLGGMSNVTKNMYIYEYWEEGQIKDIVIVDCGVGFLSHLETLGIDCAIPDASYLKDKTQFIRALLVTHGHEDHIGAMQYILPQVNFPPIFAPKLAALLIRGKLAEVGMEKASISIVKQRHDYHFGSFKVRFFNMTHSIPDTNHIFMETPVGNIYHGADYKFDLTPVYGEPPDFAEITRAAEKGVKVMLSDGLGSEREGYTLSEMVVGKTLDEEMRRTKGRFFMTTFASNISRIKQCVEASLKYNRKVCFIGRSMQRNMEIAVAEGYIKLGKENIIPPEKLKAAASERLCVILTGSQGEYGSALEKVAGGRHRFLKIQKGDRILFSSDPIPGNETHVQEVIENIIEQGADVVYTAIRDALHASGHGSQEDHKLLARLTKARYLVPIGTTTKHSHAYAAVMKDLGYRDEQVFTLHSGEPLVVEGDKVYIDTPIELKEVLVDAGTIGDVNVSILKEREDLGKEGVLIVHIHGDSIQLVSRGFIFYDKSLFGQIEEVTRRVLKRQLEKEALKKALIVEIADFVGSKLRRSPEVIPLVA